MRRYLARSEEDLVWDLIRLAYSSVAATVVVPMQDFLVLGSEARMNLPSTVGGNWSWRMDHTGVNDWTANRCRELAWLYNRLPPLKA